MVLFTRTDFSTPATAIPIFHEHRYAVVDEAGNVLKDVVIEGLYKDTGKLSRREAGSDNNVVQAIALSPDGRYIYAHERPTTLSQHIVRRNLEDFSIEGAITSLNSYTNGMWFNGKRRNGMAIGFAIDDYHLYLHTQDEVIAYDLTLSKIIWKRCALEYSMRQCPIGRPMYQTIRRCPIVGQKTQLPQPMALSTTQLI